MKLVIDQGNTLTKCGFFSEKDLVLKLLLSDLELDNFRLPCEVDNVLLSTVRSEARLPEVLQNTSVRMIPQPHEVGFHSSYQGNKLGSDRFANAAGAMALFPGESCLIVDCGTCITYTVLEDGIIRGGAISPGIRLRFTALHQFTGRLPFIQYLEPEVPAIVGADTEGSIRSGVFNGILAETDGLIGMFCSQNPDLRVLLTGGDQSFFGAHLKSRIFAHPDLTLIGLNEILDILVENNRPS